MMMEDLWTVFCGQSNYANDDIKPCGGNLALFIKSSSCVNHATIISFDIFLLALLLSTIVCRMSSPKVEFITPYRRFSTLQLFSATFNGCLGAVYISLGAWNLKKQLKNDHSVVPLHWWFLFFVHGFTWLLVGLIVSLRGMCFPKAPVRALSISAFLFSGVSCFFALLDVVINQDRTTKIVLDVISFLGASLLLLCTYKGYKYEVTRSEDMNRSTLYTPLSGETNESSNIDSTTYVVTPFAKAGVFNRMSFCWLNSLVKLGREKALKEEDIPKIRDEESAKSCYLEFMDKLNKQNSSILWAIVACHWREIIISGIYAFLKILTVSAGPLLLNVFIEVAEGKEAFKYQGYLLAFSLFISKILESLSQRQWYFRTKTIGLKVRSLLTALIYRKQLKLSNSAKIIHSSGEIMNYVNVDAYRIGEFPFWFHQTWTTSLQLCIALVILINSVGLATIASLIVVILTVICNTPLAKLQLKFQSKLMVAQDARLKASSEALINMKVLKLYAWETHFRNVIEDMREKECYWLSKVQLRRAYNGLLFWISPVLVSVATFGACYFLGIPLHASNVFTFVATLRLVQDPIRAIPEVIAVVIQAKVAFARIVKFLEAPEIKNEVKSNVNCANHAVLIKCANLSWEMNSSKLTLKNINLDVLLGQKVAICGEVGSGKSTLLAAILGEVPNIQGNVEVFGRIAYVSQTAWIQTGTIRDNILFGSSMDELRYQETLRRCSLVKDFELLPDGDMTEIGERGVNLSGGQKQRVQLARALYQDADIYLLDDPFSAVDAQTATSLFTEYVVEALSKKTVLLVTHQVDFLPAFNCCLLISDGEILQAGPYAELLASSQEFSDLVNAHRETAATKNMDEVNAPGKHSTKQVQNTDIMQQHKISNGVQLIKREEREVGDSGLKPYSQYLSQNKGYLYLSLVFLTHLTFIIGQISQNSWMASNVDNPHVNESKLIVVYLVIGFTSTLFLPARSLLVVTLGLKASKSICTQLLNSLFRAPMSFYDCTPLGRVLTRISSDMSIVDLDVPFSLLLSLASTMMTYANLVVLGVITWQVLFVSIPVIYMAIRLQRYYFATAKELMRINGTTKSLVANHLAESIAGAVMIRAFEEEERFFSKNLDLIDTNSSPFFHNFAASEWLIQRLETLCAFVLATAATCMVFLPAGSFSSGFIGMALSYGLSLNGSMVFSIQNQCTLANQIISMERLNQYMHIESEAPEVVEENRPPQHWPLAGKVEIYNLQIRYRPDSPLVLRGITCTFEGGDKIGIVGRTGSGKTTLIGALFRLVEPVAGKITVDGIDICSIGLHDLRSHFGIIPQDPTLFNGTVRFNLDPLCQHMDEEIWEVLGKCQLKEVVEEKEKGLDSLVVEDGSNWSMGQRQLFCLGRALLRRSRILVLDEATASIDNATDMILQKTIRIEFAKCTVITVAHRIPTVLDSTKVLAISDGRMVEYDEPTKLMKKDDSLFSQLVKEYWSHIHFAERQ